ncbi:MAG TPA: hypothetical protein PK609_01505 [Candidatus Paceibacterota bacterium]|nr:hypothetical protein [Candidatus Paceibacterota bacterium]
MSKFLVLYLAPAAGLEEWMKTPEEERKVEEDAMKKEWDEWTEAHKDAMVGMTAGTGKTKRITPDGVADTKNDVMLCSIIEAESHEEAANLFVGHPHFGIPGGSIEVMPLNYLPGMEGA